MYYAVDVPVTGAYSDPRTLVALARDAEAAGWDGFFIWDDVSGGPDAPPMADPWITLAAIAASTERIRFGPMIAVLPRRRPWKVARETVSLDRLSDGRLILGVGIGGDPGEGQRLGEEPDPRVRAAMLDECLEMLTGLWSGEPFSHTGRHYRLRDTRFLPTPVQSPRIPIWVGGVWPNKPPFRRAARWDGVFPIGRDLSFTEMMSPAQVRDMVAYVLAHREEGRPLEVAHWGITSGNDPARDAATVAEYAESGVTWWLENVSPSVFGGKDEEPWPVEAMRERIRNGPSKG